MSEHTRTRTTETETESETEREETNSCPECSGTLVADSEHGETVCTECG
ncbi:MAG: TFIIB-type zinc ribbon-containing protein, partial [Natronomonas sp.]